MPDSRRLEFITTIWDDVLRAHRGQGAEQNKAREALVLRYNSAIRKYVGALVRDAQDADELAQEVVVRLLRGQFAAAAPDKGSFRRMLSVATRNLVRTYWARKKRSEGAPLDMAQLSDESVEQAEQEGLVAWRAALLDLAWRALEQYERTHPGSVTWTVLRLRTDHPDEEAEELARRLSERTGRSFEAAALRQQLRRARVRFARLLLEEVARGLDSPTPERVEEELGESGLLAYIEELLPDDWRASLPGAEGP